MVMNEKHDIVDDAAWKFMYLNLGLNLARI